METVFRTGERGDKHRPSRVNITDKTVNSAGSGVFSARIFCFEDNPLKYQDPDGRENKLVNNISVPNSEDIIVGIGGGDYSGGFPGIGSLGLSVGIVAMAGIASKSISIPTTMAKTQTKNQNLASIRMQVQPEA